MMPADLLAHERARVKTRRDEGESPTSAVIKAEDRSISIRAWQARWDRTPTVPDAVGQKWTNRLIPNISRWLAKPMLVLTYHLTQAMTGHGCFCSYLAKRNRADDSYCGYCMDPDDTAEHTEFDCPRWLDDRARLTEILSRPPNAGDVEDILCSPSLADLADDSFCRKRLISQAKTNHHELVTMIDSIMATKEEDEREDQAYHRAASNRRRRAHLV